MERLPAECVEEPEVLDPEIVGLEPPPLPIWKRFLLRTALGAVFFATGAGALLLGIVFTLTIVGAFIGIPLIVLGLALMALAVFLPMRRDGIKVVSLRWSFKKGK
ncbi:MAG: hypothetical protein HY551_07965 [Elusimicrobia bacterium]|nr:hypothetical protein [Elusimicrobiota bacterium]